MDPLEYQAERWRRIKVLQDEDPRLQNLKKFLRCEVDGFSRTQIRRLSKEADLFELDRRDSLRQDMLHYAHEGFQGDHQGIMRTHEKLRSDFYWYGMYADVKTFVKESDSPIRDRLYGLRHTLAGVRPGNTILFRFQDMFSGYAMCKPMSSTIAQEVAEAYEDRVCHRPQANGQQERSVQTVIQSVRAYVAEADQSN
ncbi:reverse transcriptase [Phytophthora megakarya]|uniref:Reverse transcriptase n=1 Tax=Phytophthora megakarya TaxID=4795 RepID=A0A225VLN1_9STRA|nr:reverse transcriptase [Phytophthora megakarya]